MAAGSYRPRKTYESNFSNHDFEQLKNSENSIRDFRPFCRPLFCHSSVVKYTSFLLQYWTRNKIWLPNISEIAPPKLTGWIRPWHEHEEILRSCVIKLDGMVDKDLRKTFVDSLSFLFQGLSECVADAGEEWRMFKATAIQ